MIFGDTSYWYALRARDDGRAAEAAALARLHGDEAILTTNHVAGETWTLLRRRRGHSAARDFLDRVERSPRIEVVDVAPDVEAEAWAWLRRHDERPYSFVDATSFAVMRRHGITRALAFDEEFSAAGFEVLTA